MRPKGKSQSAPPHPSFGHPLPRGEREQGVGRRCRRAAFVDRDGTLIHEQDYLRDPNALELIPGAAAALHELREMGYLVIVVTNQAGVARGLMSEKDVLAVNRRLCEVLEREGAQLDDILYCPHHPSEGEAPYRLACTCRKPEPGMLLSAARIHGIELGRSFLVGDRGSDIEAAHRARCRGVLVRTGYGATELGRELIGAEKPDWVCDDLGAISSLVGGFHLRTSGSTTPP